MRRKEKSVFFSNLILDFAASVILGIGICSFIEPARIAPGGVSGVSLILKYIWGVPVGTMNLILNIPLLFLAFRYLGKNFTRNSLRMVLISGIVLDGIVAPFFPQYTGDRMISAIFGGVCCGFALGLIFNRGGTTGGTDIASYLLERKFPHIPIGQMLMILDAMVIGISVFVFKDLDAALYAAVTLFCQTKVINGMVYGREKGTVVHIISKKSHEIAQTIMENLERGVTVWEGYGAYSKEEKQILYCAVRMREYPSLKKIVYQIDSQAFLVAAEAIKIHGEGFKKPEE